MKKTLLGLSVAAALGLFLSPSMAAANPVLSDADQAFLASLAGASVGTPAPQPAAKRPGITPKSLCTATANCGGGVTITCSSNTSVSSCSAADRNCNVERGHVTCDGMTTLCSPACPGCPPDWCTGDCTDVCFPCSGSLICNGPPGCFSRCKCDFVHCAQ
ncbi:MAG TPA: hypothetical protein VF173_30385 [Thermoanaerobaculia bacterium]|nr:hypothetical protein [Thermoanaerobaculia bacterium]